MGTYIPPYTISEKMLEQVNNRIRSIHSSLKIEANSLSLNEVTNGVKENEYSSVIQNQVVMNGLFKE